jgi:hypothetical protein
LLYYNINTFTADSRWYHALSIHINVPFIKGALYYVGHREDVIMNYVRNMLVIAAVVLATGCAGSARQDYYLAMQQAAASNAAQAEARYRALATVASQGDPSSQIAATMAIALTQDKTITPQYVESESLSWARVLANPLATLGMGAIQAGVAKNASDNAAQVQMASYASNEAIQLGQQNMISTLGSQWSAGAAASSAQLVDLGVAGFTALNTAGEQTVNLGIAGFTANENIATAGFTANENIATVGFATVDSVATTGFTTVDSVATTGFDTATVLGVAGITEVSTVGQAGMTNLVDLGTTSINGLNTMSADYNSLISGITTTNAGTIDTLSTSYSATIADINNTIDSILADDPVVCQDNGSGTIVCN